MMTPLRLEACHKVLDTTPTALADSPTTPPPAKPRQGMKAPDSDKRQGTSPVKTKTKAETKAPPPGLALAPLQLCMPRNADDGTCVADSPASPSSAPSPMGPKPASDLLHQQLVGQGGALPPGRLHCLSYHDSPRAPDQLQQQPQHAAGQGHGRWQQQQGRGGDGSAAGAAVPQRAADEKRRQRNRRRSAAYKARQQQRKKAEAALQAQQQQQQQQQLRPMQKRRRYRQRQQQSLALEREQQHQQQWQAPASTPIRSLDPNTMRMVLVAALRAATSTKAQDVPGLAAQLHRVAEVQAPGGVGGNGRTVQQVRSTSPRLGASAARGPVDLAAKWSAPVSLDLIGGVAGLDRAVQLLLQRHKAAGACRGQHAAAAAAADGADAFAVWSRSLPAALLGELRGDAVARAALDGGDPDGAARWLQCVLGFDVEVTVKPCGEVTAKLLTVTAWAEGGTVAAEVTRLADSVRAGEVDARAAAVRVVQLMEQVACVPGVLERCRLAWGDLKLENLVRVWCPEAGWQLRMIDVDDIQRVGAGAAGGQWRSAPVTGFYCATALYMAPEMALRWLGDCRGSCRHLRAKYGVRCPAVMAIAGHLEAALGQDWWDHQGGEVPPLGELGACGGVPYLCVSSDMYIVARCMQEACKTLEQAMLEGCEGRMVDAGVMAVWEKVLGALRGLAERCLALQPSQRPGAEDIRRELCALLQRVKRGQGERGRGELGSWYGL